MSTDVHALVSEEDPDHDWVIPGLMDRGDRCIVTANEGDGKSTLLRQTGLQAAAGVQFCTGDPTPPVRALIIDFENSRSQVRSKLRQLLPLTPDLPTDQLHVQPHPEGIDLQYEADRTWFRSEIAEFNPDLVLTGPLYKMCGGDPSSEQQAKLLSGTLDRLRTEYGFALMIEAHSPYAQGDALRAKRPYGASLWSRWPEFGIHLGKDGAITHWRNPRESRDWPARLHRGGVWPWMVDPKGATFAKLTAYALSIGSHPSLRDIEQHLSCSRSTAQRIIDANREQWERMFDDAL